MGGHPGAHVTLHPGPAGSVLGRWRDSTAGCVEGGWGGRCCYNCGVFWATQPRCAGQY